MVTFGIAATRSRYAQGHLGHLAGSAAYGIFRMPLG
jgi:hypothetical protein